MLDHQVGNATRLNISLVALIWIGIVSLTGVLNETRASGTIVHNGLQLQLTVSEKHRATGHIVIESILGNNIGSDIHFLPWATPLASQMTAPIFSVLRDEEPLQYQGMLLKRRPPTEQDYTLLPSGERIVAELDISASYDFCQRGKYQLAYHGVLPLLGGGGIDVSSNTVTFTVKKTC